MKASELRLLSDDELQIKLLELKKDLFNLRMQLATRQLENANRIPETKREIARVKTILRENTIREAAAK